MNFAIVVAYLAIILATGYGWIMNLYMLATASSYGTFEIIRAIGVLAAPLGVVLGYVG